jgi:hypothetical protein
LTVNPSLFEANKWGKLIENPLLISQRKEFILNSPDLAVSNNPGNGYQARIIWGIYGFYSLRECVKIINKNMLNQICLPPQKQVIRFEIELKNHE